MQGIMPRMDAMFFPTPADFRAWLAEHHDSETELWVGLHKKASGRPGITWPESVDQALCYGWIDAVRKSIDAESYRIRFTRRKPGSHWSKVNIKRIGELIEQGLVQPAGLKAFESRSEGKSGRASYEQESVEFPPEYLAELKSDAAAWTFFSTQAPSHQRTATWWVISAKREETRRKRLAILVSDSASGLRIKPLRRDQGA
jgi:uncharacterized protein YdeI (YjbR/CyaY-like superfamily)